MCKMSFELKNLYYFFHKWNTRVKENTHHKHKQSWLYGVAKKPYFKTNISGRFFSTYNEVREMLGINFLNVRSHISS